MVDVLGWVRLKSDGICYQTCICQLNSPVFFQSRFKSTDFEHPNVGNHRNFNQTIKPWDIGDSWTKTWILMELDNQKTPMCEFAQVLWWPKKKLWGLVGYTVSWLVLKLEISTIITQIRRKGLINHRTPVFGEKTHGPLQMWHTGGKKLWLLQVSIMIFKLDHGFIYIYVCVSWHWLRSSTQLD